MIVSFAASLTACEDGPILPLPSTGGAGPGGSGGAGGTGGTGGGGTGGGGTGGTGGGSTVEYSFTVTKGFTGAESCLWDPVSQHWYVSNLAPMSMDLTVPDGEGWISRLDKDGALVDEKWVSGLNTPAGLRISQGVIYVNDINEIKGYNVATGGLEATHKFPAALLLNDPAIDEANGKGYATDTFGNAIYTFTLGVVGSEDLLVASPDLKGPNGLLFDGGELYVGSLVDFDPMNLGPFLTVDPGTQAITQIGTTLGKFDGLEKYKGAFLLSDNQAGRLLVIQPDGASEVLVDLFADHQFAPAADIGIDPERNLICVPNLGDSVAFVQVK